MIEFKKPVQFIYTVLLKSLFIPLLTGVSLLIIFNNNLLGQANFHGFSLSPKFGASFGKTSIGSNSAFEFNYLFRDYIFTLDFMDEVDLDYDLKLGVSKSNYVSVIAGKYFDNKKFRFIVQGGLSYLKNEIKTSYLIPKDTFPWVDTYETSSSDESFGVLGNFETKLVLSRYFSLGIDFNLNINKIQTKVIPFLSIEAGILKPQKEKSLNENL
jgi:hypothetical protein